MPVPRLNAENTVLLVVDVQERLMPVIADRKRLVNNCAVMVRMASELGIPTLLTEQYVKGLGRTVPEIADCMPDPSRRVEKTRFSALVDVIDDQINRWRRSDVLVCGIEAHVCVLQTVLDLQATGRQTWLVSDAISASKADQIPLAFRRMERAGSIPTGVISSMYELMEDATHPAFRTLLKLAKAVNTG